MILLAPGVRLLSGFPPNQVNAYLVEDVLVDAGTSAARHRILRQVADHGLRAHVVTHAHPDHFGASHAVCTALDIPLWAGRADREAIETGRPVFPPGPLSRILQLQKARPHEVDRVLAEGDDVEGFVVLQVPGHTPGHIALWRESDGVLLCGDVFVNQRRIGPPPAFLTWDPSLNRAAMRKLAALNPRLVLFGHGRPARLAGTEALVV
jgi:hydroxyacylglutathione hydrolase